MKLARGIFWSSILISCVSLVICQVTENAAWFAFGTLLIPFILIYGSLGYISYKRRNREEEKKEG